MSPKKKSKKKQARPASLTSDEESLVQSLLNELKSSDPDQLVAKIPGPHVARHFIERLPLTDVPPPALLTALDEGFKDKAVRKAVKRFLFKLEKSGLSTEGLFSPKERPGAVLKAPAREAPAAYLGALDASGSRAVMVTFHRSPKGVDLGIGVVSDELGIQQFLFGNFSRKGVREMQANLAGEVGQMVETTLSHLATVLERAHQRQVEGGSQVSADYLELRPWLLEQGPLLEGPDIYDHLPEAPKGEGLLTDSRLETLFANELMASWVVDYESLRPYVEETLQMDDSPIVLTETQKFDRGREIRERAMGTLFPAPKRAALKGRLEEMAYFFLKLDEGECAGICIDAARSLDPEESALLRNPFIEFLLKRSFDFYGQAARPADVGDAADTEAVSRIILP